GSESVGQEFFAEFDVKARVGSGIGSGKLLLGPALHLRGHLAEGVFLVVALDALEWRLRGRAARNNTAAASRRRERVEQHFCFSVVRAAIERRVQFAGRAGAIASLGKSHSQVKVIVGVAGIVLNRSLEIIGGRLRTVTTAGGDHSKVVVHLGQRQALGDERKGAFRFREVPVSVGGETEVEICLAGDLGRTLHLTQRRDRRFVSALRVVGLAQFQPGLSIVRIEADRFAIALYFFFSGCSQHAAYVVFQG